MSNLSLLSLNIISACALCLLSACSPAKDESKSHEEEAELPLAERDSTLEWTDEIHIVSPSQLTVRKTYEREIHALLMDGKYQALNEMLPAIVSGEAKFDDGIMKMGAFFYALSTPTDEEKDDNWAELRKRLTEWRNNGGGDAASVALADYYTGYAWYARGEGYSNTVSGSSWHKFDERLEMAARTLEGIEDISKCPYGYRVWEYVALGQGWSHEKFEELFNEARDLMPDYEGFYFSGCFYWLPRWYGEPGDWENFLNEQVEEMGDGPLIDGIYARCLWYLIERGIYNHEERIFQLSSASWPIAQRGFEHLLAQYPDSVYLLSQYTLMASEANDPETAYNLFLRLQGRCDVCVWGSVNNFKIYRDWAQSRTGM